MLDITTELKNINTERLSILNEHTFAEDYIERKLVFTYLQDQATITFLTNYKIRTL